MDMEVIMGRIGSSGLKRGTSLQDVEKQLCVWNSRGRFELDDVAFIRLENLLHLNEQCTLERTNGKRDQQRLSVIRNKSMVHQECFT